MELVHCFGNSFISIGTLYTGTLNFRKTIGTLTAHRNVDSPD